MKKQFIDIMKNHNQIFVCFFVYNKWVKPHFVICKRKIKRNEIVKADEFKDIFEEDDLFNELFLRFIGYKQLKLDI